MDPVGIVSIGRDGIVNRQQQYPKLRDGQEYLRRGIQGPGLSRFLLDQNGDVLIEQVYDQNHSPDKEPVQNVVQKQRHRVQVVDRVDRRGIKDQMNQHDDQQQRKGPVQQTVLPPGGKINHRHKGQNQKQRDFHSKHGIHLSDVL